MTLQIIINTANGCTQFLSFHDCLVQIRNYWSQILSAVSYKPSIAYSCFYYHKLRPKSTLMIVLCCKPYKQSLITSCSSICAYSTFIITDFPSQCQHVTLVLYRLLQRASLRNQMKIQLHVYGGL